MSTDSINRPEVFPIHCFDSFHDFCFEPIKFSGRLWIWIQNDSDNTISNIALKIFTVPLFAITSTVSIPFTLLGLLIFQTEGISSNGFTYSGQGSLAMVGGRTIFGPIPRHSNRQLKEEITDRFNQAGFQFEVEVNTHLLDFDDDKRTVSIHDPTTSLFTVIAEKLKFLFFNKVPISDRPLQSFLDIGIRVEDIEDASKVRDILKRNYFIYYDFS